MSVLDKIKESIVAKMLILVIITWSILAIIFGFTDLLISKAVVDQNSVLGNFGADYGEGPGYGLIAISIVVLIGSYQKDIKKQKLAAWITVIVGLLLLVVGIAISSDTLINYGAFIGGAVLIFTVITLKKDWSGTEYKSISIVIMLLAIINPLLFVQIVKVIVGRVRPYNVLYNHGNYTPWFVVNGYTNGENLSFPSGHTAMGFMFLPLLIVVRNLEWKNPKKILVWIVVVGWAIFVGASRVAVGAHFASDVLFSAGMASVVTILLYKKFYLNQKK